MGGGHSAFLKTVSMRKMASVVSGRVQIDSEFGTVPPSNAAARPRCPGSTTMPYKLSTRWEVRSAHLPAGALGQPPAELLLGLPPRVLLRDQLQRATRVAVHQPPVWRAGQAIPEAMLGPAGAEAHLPRGDLGPQGERANMGIEDWSLIGVTSADLCGMAVAVVSGFNSHAGTCS